MKTKTIFNCSHCDSQYQKWVGRCSECGKWGSVEETTVNQRGEEKNNPTVAPTKTTKLSEIKGTTIQRFSTNIDEIDRVLGGGLVPGVLILLGGEPGIGKSTLSIQLANIVPNTIYFSGEESIGQIKLRADRLRITSDSLELANETSVEIICATIKSQKPKLAVIDSIQTIYSSESPSELGSVNQVKACTTKLLETAKSTNTAICIIGHVTKDGNVAGPKTLEHLVDTVLYLEGDRYHAYRILRTIKNRFGSTNEIGIFEMKNEGLTEVKNASASFIEERGESTSGSVITCLLEGTRPILVEVQALVNKTSFGFPVRKASGFDLNRLHVLIAVLQKRAGLNLSEYDVHLNIAGGVKTKEPAVDLAVCLAIASSFKDKELGKDLVAFGEVGLGGEIRNIPQTEKRIKECENLGMKRAITAKSTKSVQSKMKLIEVTNIQELIRHT
ncbi:MAG: DNA repair protein RadA [Candidatus Magasanikbacteria bacterium CG_4_9_14_3_um_filter_32_9]|uniref:DNA repair protein RadA n=1 Tax=Candidatus Magasanikbacteria bacterium CG_4_9_14_3_um_filter_32_9 TaxID=1974644 RepID=A0A2M7Z6D3_9BACT|nr:MAG: DNA repair protein RadA [Candidatus Magasanikbacteria bacterium CG_4_9_14_3_um_filter_32_9]